MDPNAQLLAWNAMDAKEAAAQVLPCCGSAEWATRMAAARPYRDIDTLLLHADRVWAELDQADWDEAFLSHPRIGETNAPPAATAQSAAWSSQEQSDAGNADDAVRMRLRVGNAAYEQRFGRTYIVCATGKSAEQMLAILEQRLKNGDARELREAVEQQRQITQIRMKKWLRI